MRREMLPNRRAQETFEFESVGSAGTPLRFRASVGFYPDGRVGELFVNSGTKIGTDSDTNASDAAIAVSIALQYGCPVDVLRSAMARDGNGRPLGPIGTALDIIADRYALERT